MFSDSMSNDVSDRNQKYDLSSKLLKILISNTPGFFAWWNLSWTAWLHWTLSWCSVISFWFLFPGFSVWLVTLHRVSKTCFLYDFGDVIITYFSWSSFAVFLSESKASILSWPLSQDRNLRELVLAASKWSTNIFIFVFDSLKSIILFHFFIQLGMRLSDVIIKTDLFFDLRLAVGSCLTQEQAIRNDSLEQQLSEFCLSAARCSEVSFLFWLLITLFQAMCSHCSSTHKMIICAVWIFFL